MGKIPMGYDSAKNSTVYSAIFIANSPQSSVGSGPSMSVSGCCSSCHSISSGLSYRILL